MPQAKNPIRSTQPSFQSLMQEHEKRQCEICGETPAWSRRTGTLIMGGRCKLHSLDSPEGLGDKCENCGGGSPPGRCADCVLNNRFRPSAILEEFSQIHGRERMLLIRWSGYEMAEDSLTHKNHLETDYTGLQAQLTRRRTERTRRRQDRYIKSVLACKCAPMGVKKNPEVGHTRIGPDSREMEERGGQ